MRRKIAAIAGALIMTLGLAGPVMASGDTDIQVTVSIQESGKFNYAFWGGGYDNLLVGLGTIPVTTNTGGTIASVNQRINLNETHASSAGWALSLDASDFTDSNSHLIENENIAMYSNSMVNQYGDCLHGNAINPLDPAHSDLAPNPTNPFQSITPLAASSASPVSLGSTVSLVTASSGRGCGTMGVSIYYKVNIPAGTYTGGGTTVYTSTLLLTSSIAPNY